MEIQIRLQGCDDDTIFTMQATKEQFEYLEKVSQLSKQTSKYGCMPIFLIQRL